MFSKIKFNYFFSFLVLAFLYSCEIEEIIEVEENQIQTDALQEDLYGIWSIYRVKIGEEEANVPPTTEDCGRDFFIFTENGSYNEYLFQSSNCIPTENTLEWNLEKGVLQFSSKTSNETDILEINTLNKDSFVFSANIDIDGDNVAEKYTFYALKYLPPNENDIYSSTFSRREEAPFSGHIEFSWNAYKGYNSFEKYEVYRSNNACNINSATLLTTITEVDKTNFIDENPLEDSEACYFFKIYTDKGLLGESEPRYVNPEFIIPENTKFTKAETIDNTIQLTWEKYSGYYFSHYEIRVQDQNENSSPNVESVQIITDINITSFTDLNPPFVNNPIYSIYVHNKFGNISNFNVDENLINTDLTRPELLGFDSIKFLNFDAEDQCFFFYGKNFSNENRLIKYNYIDKKIVAESFKLPTTYTEVEMKIITSNYGKELIFSQGSDLWVYNTSDLTYKYSLKIDNIFMNSFDYLGDNIWVASDNDDLHSYSREEDKLIQIDEKAHFEQHQGSMNYEITVINKNNLLLSHNNEGRAIHYGINSEGILVNNGIKQIPLQHNYNSDVYVNATSNLLLNKQRNSIYTTTDFSIIENYNAFNNTFNFNKQGTAIFGNNNLYNVSNEIEYYKKELIIYDFQNKTTNTLATKGFPLFVAEDNFGNIVSLSSAFYRKNYYDFHNNNVDDFFIEIIK